MTGVQLDIFGTEHPIDATIQAPLTDAQREILRAVAADGSITTAAAGRIVHAHRNAGRGCRKGQPLPYDGVCCRFMSSDGTDACRRLADVVALDIVQKLPFQAGLSRTQVLEDAVQRLDAYAKDTGAHVLLVGQVNRQRADGTFPMPGMADIKDCAELGNGPDNVLFVWREQDRRTLEMEPEGVIRVAKYRGGRLETIDATFNGEYQRWTERPHLTAA